MTAKELLFERFPEAADVPRIPNATEEMYRNELHLREVLEFAGWEWAEIKARARQAETETEPQEA
jgi:hypothetical protein